MPSAKQHEIRIIGGIWRGRKLPVLNQTAVRPTPDRIRETLFNWLGQNLSGKTCLDLFAGSGALGFEAASRGAQHVVMVDSDQTVFQTLQKTKTRLGSAQVKLIKMRAQNFLMADTERFNIVFLDPPYRLNLIPELLPVISQHLAEDGLVYIEYNEPLVLDSYWRPWRSKKAGSVYYQLLEYITDGIDYG